MQTSYPVGIFKVKLCIRSVKIGGGDLKRNFPEFYLSISSRNKDGRVIDQLWTQSNSTVWRMKSDTINNIIVIN